MTNLELKGSSQSSIWITLWELKTLVMVGFEPTVYPFLTDLRSDQSGSWFSTPSGNQRLYH